MGVNLLAELTLAPFTVTVMEPVLVPAGTGTMICVPLHEVGVDSVALKRTVLVPMVDPNPVPIIVMWVPGGPVWGEKLVIASAAAVTVKLASAVAVP